MKITQLSSLNEVQIHLVKQLIKECQMFDGTQRAIPIKYTKL